MRVPDQMILWLLVLLCVLSCGGSSSSGPDGGGGPSVSQLRVVGSPPQQIREGQTFEVTVEALGSSGAPVAGAEASLHAVSSNPAVVILLSVAGGLSPAGAATFHFRAIGPGQATITISYPCPVSQSGCQPQRQIQFGLTVLPGVSQLRFAPGEAVLLQVGGSASVVVQTVDSRGEPLPVPESEIQTISTAPEIAVIERNIGAPGDGQVQLTIRALQQGGALLRATHPLSSVSGELEILVIPTAARVSIEPAQATLVVSQRALFTIRVLDAGGALVPDGELGVEVEESDTTKAKIIGTVDPVHGDGTLQIRVEARATGTARILVSYPGAASSTAEIEVVEKSSAPSIEDIVGVYSLEGVLRENACSGEPSARIQGTAGIEASGASMLRMTSTQGVFEAPYDPVTGSWPGVSAPTGGAIQTRLRHEGSWQFASDDSVVFRGTLSFEFLATDGSLVCHTVYDVEYRRF